jgi:hypothetical protein
MTVHMCFWDVGSVTVSAAILVEVADPLGGNHSHRYMSLS